MKFRIVALGVAAVLALAAGAVVSRPSLVSAQVRDLGPVLVPANPLVWDPSVSQTLPITSCSIVSITYRGPAKPPGDQMVMSLKCLGAPKEIAIILPDAASVQLATTVLAGKASRPPGQGGVQVTASHTVQNYYSLTWMEAW